jgi:hypothetical protein
MNIRSPVRDYFRSEFCDPRVLQEDKGCGMVEVMQKSETAIHDFPAPIQLLRFRLR